MSEEAKNIATNLTQWAVRIAFALLAFFAAQTFYGVQRGMEKISDKIMDLNNSHIELRGKVNEHEKEIDRLERTKADKH